MTNVSPVQLTEFDAAILEAATGPVSVVLAEDGKLHAPARTLNKFARGLLKRVVESEDFLNAKDGDLLTIRFPTALTAPVLLVGKLSVRASAEMARALGGKMAKAAGKGDMTILAGNTKEVVALSQGVALRAYSYQDQKSEPKAIEMTAHVMHAKAADHQTALANAMAAAEGVFFTRDLVNAPANVLTTTSFADQLAAMKSIGLKVKVLEEKDLEKLGMRTLLSVGQGSDSPSKVVVMEWKGGGDEAPFALVGKGVVFDTGGISLKPAGGMEDMTMDMGGAGVVAGAMRSLALRKAKANVVGLVGLVENMPSGNATRPGDVVKSMKGDTVEIINTDAEGRLVLADVLWYAQEKFKPAGMINLATLTGAIIIGLGHEKAGVFSNNDKLCNQFMRAADAEAEGAWRMPLGEAYDAQLKSDIADMKNVGGRAAGSITAGQFLQRFVDPEMPWIHLDIAGVAALKSETALSPKGATGWGVRALDRLISDHYENVAPAVLTEAASE